MTTTTTTDRPSAETADNGAGSPTSGTSNTNAHSAETMNAQRRLEERRRKLGIAQGRRFDRATLQKQRYEDWAKRMEAKARGESVTDAVTPMAESSPAPPSHPIDRGPMPKPLGSKSNRAQTRPVRCTNCGSGFWLVLTRRLRLRKRPCPECGGRLRLASWGGFLDQQPVPREVHNEQGQR